MNGNFIQQSEANALIDPLDEKLIAVFPGRVVRKDLVQKLKVGFSIPVFVLEYLLGKYCSSMDDEEIANGLIRVKEEIAERVVRADQGELIKARLQRTGSMKLIDLVTVTFDEKDQGGKYWARLATSGLERVHIDESLVHKYERVLTGGVWANAQITYDESLVHGGVTRPFVLSRMQPIQIASARIEEFIEGRQSFTREEWVDVLLRTVGYEPTHPDFTWRGKLIGTTSKAIKESARMAFDYLRGNARRIGLERDFGSYDFNIQVMSPMQGKDTEDLGVAFFVAVLSAVVCKNIAPSLVVLGQMSIHGVLGRVERLGDRIRVAMDSGAKQVMIPTVNAPDLGSIPTELLDKTRIEFFSEPIQAAHKALAEV